MRLIISTNSYSHQNYKTTKTFKNVDWSKVECLIFHSSIDNEVDIILELSKAGEKVKKIIYINQTLNSLFYGLFSGLNADIYNDATMLEDESILDYLIDNYKNTGMTIKSLDEDVETISKFLATVSKESAETLKKLLENASWVKTVEYSVNNVGTALVRTNEANINMVDMFNRTADIIADLEESHEKTTQEIEKLSESLSEIEKKNSSGKSSTAFYYNTFTIPNSTPKVLYIKVYTPCHFLNSFIFAYQDYLKMRKGIKSKILFAVPKLKNFMVKYDNLKLPRLSLDSVNSLDLKNLGDAFVTFEPKPAVLNSFFSMRPDIFIVIDMMFGDNLIAGAKVIPLYAVNSISDIKLFNLDSTKCITPFVGQESNITIPYIKGYVNELTESRRKTLYAQNCGEDVVDKSTNKVKLGAYKKIDIALGLNIL